MSEIKKQKQNKRKMSKSATMLVIGLLVIFIPCAIYAGILISAALQTGSPILGERFDGDLDPAITKNDISSIETKLSSIDGVEEVEVVLLSGQMRVNVNVDDALTNEQIEVIIDEAYEGVTSVLSIDKYFTSNNGKRMYDLAINVYNLVDPEDDSMVYYILTKNAMMEEKTIQLVSEPLNPDLAADLRGENETENTTDTTE